jgi:hypothetical protein
MEEYVLYCNQSAILDLPCNSGIREALERIEELRRQGMNIRIVDTAQMSEDELQTAYLKAITPSVMKKYAIRKVFGSQQHAGSTFGRGVPALAVQSESGRMTDVFPHREAERVVTMNEFLCRLPAKDTSV